MEKLLGHQLKESSSVKQSISLLANEVEKISRQIEQTRPPQEAFIKQNQILTAKIGENRGRPLFYPYVGTGIGHGPYVELEDGSVKLDLINGIGIHILGHSHPKIIEAMLEGALSDIVTQGNLQANREYLEMGDKLVQLAKKSSRLAHAWITTSGSMANENALKMCRQKKSPARKIIAMKDSFAGRTTMMAEITDNPAYKEGLPTYNEVLRVPFAQNTSIHHCTKGSPGGCALAKQAETSLNILKGHVEQNKGDIAAFMFEPMLGEGGYQVACGCFFEPLLKYCKEQGILVWVDEVQTFMRTGQMFAFETLGFGEYVDVCTIAKTAQVGATLYTAEMNPKAGLIAGTFAGSTPALAAGLRIMDIIEKEGYLGESGKIQKIHNEFIAMLNHLNETSCKGLLRDAGGLGLMIAVTPLDGSKEKVMPLLKTLYDNGLIAFSCGKSPLRLRFLVPAVMTSRDIQHTGDILEKSVLEHA